LPKIPGVNHLDAVRALEKARAARRSGSSIPAKEAASRAKRLLKANKELFRRLA
jgi:hypothetical protein